MTEPTLKNHKNFKDQIIAKAWQDEAFKQELLKDPKTALAKELKAEFPGDIEIRVVEETPNNLYLILPAKPDATPIIMNA